MNATTVSLLFLVSFILLMGLAGAALLIDSANRQRERVDGRLARLGPTSPVAATGAAVGAPGGQSRPAPIARIAGSDRLRLPAASALSDASGGSCPSSPSCRLGCGGLAGSAARRGGVGGCPSSGRGLPRGLRQLGRQAARSAVEAIARCARHDRAHGARRRPGAWRASASSGARPPSRPAPNSANWSRSCHRDAARRGVARHGRAHRHRRIPVLRDRGRGADADRRRPVRGARNPRRRGAQAPRPARARLRPDLRGAHQRDGARRHAVRWSP